MGRPSKERLAALASFQASRWSFATAYQHQPRTDETLAADPLFHAVTADAGVSAHELALLVERYAQPTDDLLLQELQRVALLHKVRSWTGPHPLLVLALAESPRVYRPHAPTTITLEPGVLTGGTRNLVECSRFDTLNHALLWKHRDGGTFLAAPGALWHPIEDADVERPLSACPDCGLPVYGEVEDGTPPAGRAWSRTTRTGDVDAHLRDMTRRDPKTKTGAAITSTTEERSLDYGPGFRRRADVPELKRKRQALRDVVAWSLATYEVLDGVNSGSLGPEEIRRLESFESLGAENYGSRQEVSSAVDSVNARLNSTHLSS